MVGSRYTPPTIKVGEIHYSTMVDVKTFFGDEDCIIIALNRDNTKRFLHAVSLWEANDLVTKKRKVFVDDNREPLPERFSVLEILRHKFVDEPAILMYFKPEPIFATNNMIAAFETEMSILSSYMNMVPLQLHAYSLAQFKTERLPSIPLSVSIAASPDRKQPISFNDVPVNTITD